MEDMEISEQIASAINLVLIEDGMLAAELSDETLLGDIGLDSLGFAIVIARLERVLGFDPFTEGAVKSYPLTFGDFVRIYSHFAGLQK